VVASPATARRNRREEQGFPGGWQRHDSERPLLPVLLSLLIQADNGSKASGESCDNASETSPKARLSRRLGRRDCERPFLPLLLPCYAATNEVSAAYEEFATTGVRLPASVPVMRSPCGTARALPPRCRTQQSPVPMFRGLRHTLQSAHGQKRVRPRGATRARAMVRTFRPANRGRGECRMPSGTRSLACKKTAITHTSIHSEAPETPGIPARNGFTVYTRSPRR
jgi:hypothetical protein